MGFYIFEAKEKSIQGFTEYVYCPARYCPGEPLPTSAMQSVLPPFESFF